MHATFTEEIRLRLIEKGFRYLEWAGRLAPDLFLLIPRTDNPNGLHEPLDAASMVDKIRNIAGAVTFCIEDKYLRDGDSALPPDKG